MTEQARYEVKKHEKGNPKSSPEPLDEPISLTDRSDLEKRFDIGGLGSEFEPNENFETIEDLSLMLEEIARDLVPREELNRKHTITISFPGPIGRVGVVEIEKSDKVLEKMRDAGSGFEANIKVVARDEKPQTNLLTFEVGPVFPKEEDGGTVEINIKTAFVGEPAPRLITKDRVERYGYKPRKDPDFKKDRTYWESHAFVVVGKSEELEGMGDVESQEKIFIEARLYLADGGIDMPLRFRVDDEGKILEVVDDDGYTRFGTVSHNVPHFPEEEVEKITDFLRGKGITCNGEPSDDEDGFSGSLQFDVGDMNEAISSGKIEFAMDGEFVEIVGLEDNS